VARVFLGRVEINQDTRVVHRHVDGVRREGSDDRFGAVREIGVDERVERARRRSRDARGVPRARANRLGAVTLPRAEQGRDRSPCASGMSTSVISAAGSAGSTA
jgi:hypothetical protein